MYKASVNVTLKKSVLDPQGKTVLHALETMGFEDAKDLRVGKYFEVLLDSADAGEATASIESMCDKLLTNPVIEDYTFEIQEVKSA